VNGFQDLVNTDQILTFGHPELLFQELVNYENSFRVLLESVFL
jgi:hypothetical protein